jgi:hypothetical protein
MECNTTGFPFNTKEESELKHEISKNNPDLLKALSLLKNFDKTVYQQVTAFFLATSLEEDKDFKKTMLDYIKECIHGQQIKKLQQSQAQWEKRCKFMTPVRIQGTAFEID